MFGMTVTQTPFGNRYEFSTDTPVEFLMERFDKFPRGGILLHRGTDITPTTDDDINRLRGMSGEFSLLVGAGEPATVGTYILTLMFTMAIGYMLRPDVPEEEEPVEGSPSNRLASQQNKVRLGERIPDIYGSITHTPDLIAPYYRRYENGADVEYGIFCIGRGDFDITEFKDGDVAIASLPEYSLQVYGPGKWMGDTPDYQLGTMFSSSYLTWKLVDGAQRTGLPYQQPDTMSSHWETGDSNYPLIHLINIDSVSNTLGHIHSVQSSQSYYFDDLAAYAPQGSIVDIISIHDAYEAIHNHVAVDIYPGILGEYKVLRADPHNLWLDIPPDRIDAWRQVTCQAGYDRDSHAPDGHFPDTVLTFQQSSPLLMFDGITATQRIEVSFEAPNGAYFNENNGDEDLTRRLIVDIHTLWRSKLTGIVMAVPVTVEMRGSSADGFGATFTVISPFQSGEESDVTLWVQRVDNPPTGGSADQTGNRTTLNLSFVYANLDTDDALPPEGVTTVFTELRSTFNLRDIKGRKLTVELSRNTDPAFTSAIRHAATDPAIGRMSGSNVADMSTPLAQLTDYFVSDEYVRFDHCFDKLNTSFEDMVALMAARGFSRAYRMGDVIHVKPELPETTPAMLFNHRNKVPGSETRTVRFGYENDHDGVVQEWRDSSRQDAIRQVTVSDAATPFTTKKLSIVGIRDEDVAEAHASREWNRIKNVATFTEFEAAQEAALLIPGDLILVADNTRSAVFDGDIVAQDGATLTLSRTVRLTAPSYSLWLQAPDETVQRYTIDGNATMGYVSEITVWAGFALNTSATSYARTTFLLTPASSPAPTLFRVVSIEPATRMTYKVTAEAYSDAVYDDDPTA